MKISVAYCVLLYDILGKILFKNYSSEVNPSNLEERALPFGVKYKIICNREILSKDYSYYEVTRRELITKLGKKDGEIIKVEDDKLEEFNAELKKTFTIEVSHEFKKFTPEEVESITSDDIPISREEMVLIIAYLIEDASFLRELGVENLEGDTLEEDTLKEDTTKEEIPLENDSDTPKEE